MNSNRIYFDDDDAQKLLGRNHFRSLAFVVITLEGLLTLGIEAFVFLRYWDKVTGVMFSTTLLLTSAFVVVPYLRLIRTYDELNVNSVVCKDWDEEHRSVLANSMMIAKSAAEFGISSTYAMFSLALVHIGYGLHLKS